MYISLERTTTFEVEDFGFPDSRLSLPCRYIIWNGREKLMIIMN